MPWSGVPQVVRCRRQSSAELGRLCVAYLAGFYCLATFDFTVVNVALFLRLPEAAMIDKYEIIVVGYRWFWQRLERTIDSILRTNRHHLKIHVGLNTPEPPMLAMIEKYRDRLHTVEVSKVNLNKVGMQRRLVHRCSAK